MIMQSSLLGADTVNGRGRDWLILGSVLIAAGVLRLLLFNGFFGSDDVIYLERSLAIAHGTWTSSDYIGSLRYGYNIPAAVPIWLFGLSPWSANLWSLICSLAEVAAVFIFMAAFIGRRAAVYAAVLLASAPLHIALATRIHADPVLACFLTLSFALFYAAERGGCRRLYFLAGVAMGMVFWTKEFALITLLVFVTYPVVVRRWDPKWVWTLAGGAFMFAGHLLLMQVIAADPLHVFRIVLTGVGGAGDVQGAVSPSPWYYFSYLFLDIKHTFLLAYLSLAALVLLPFRRRGATVESGSAMAVEAYIAWWLLGLLAVLSFLPLSLDPLLLVPKQTNYMNLFLAPMAMLAGAWLAALSRTALRIGLLAAAALGGVGLGVMEQAAYQVFTANSKAVVELALAHPDALVVGSVNNVRMAGARSVLDGDPGLMERVVTFSEETKRQRATTAGGAARVETLAIIDRENQSWRPEAIVIDTVPGCWTKLEDLRPLGMGLGAQVVQGLRAILALLPATLAQKLDGPLRQLVEPEVATVYRVDGESLWCGQAGPGTAGSPGRG